MSGANLRFGVTSPELSNRTFSIARFECHPDGHTEAVIILALGVLGMSANVILMALLILKRQLRKWSQGLLFHQALVDCTRAAILIPLGRSIYSCIPVMKCSLLETAFLLLVTVSTINMLTTVLNDVPLMPEDPVDEKESPILMESPQCIFFGIFMIWFASITINLGPTFLSGALAANVDNIHGAPSCPLIMGPLRHYVLNVLWIFTNLFVFALTVFHLYKLYRDLSTSSLEAVRIASLVTTMLSVSHKSGRDSNPRERQQVKNYINRMEKEGIERVKLFIVVATAYIVFWGPLFLVTLMTTAVDKPGLSHDVCLHVAYVHAIVNPVLFLVLHKGLRKAVTDTVCCNCGSEDAPLPRINSKNLNMMNMEAGMMNTSGPALSRPMHANMDNSAYFCGSAALDPTSGMSTMGQMNSFHGDNSPNMGSLSYMMNDISSMPRSLRSSREMIPTAHRSMRSCSPHN